MSSISISLLNKNRVLGAFNVAPRDLARAIQKAVEQTGGETLGKVKQIITTGQGMWKAPVDTGAMRSNIRITQKMPLKVVIEPNLSVTPYAAYVHEGTSSMRKRPFFEITAQSEEKRMQAFFQRTLDRFVKDLARKIG